VREYDIVRLSLHLVLRNKSLRRKLWPSPRRSPTTPCSATAVSGVHFAMRARAAPHCCRWMQR
jgi:hypothetical protein